MKRAHRSNWIKHHGERPAPAPWNRAGTTGLTSTLAPAPVVKERLSEPATEEFGLTLSPSRKYRSILVPVDGDPFGEHALPLALGIARRAGAEVRVVHVHCPMQPAYPREVHYESAFDVFLRRRQERYLSDLFRRLRKVTSVPVTPVFLQGRDVADSLCEAASVGTDLVVMATHHRSLLGQFWFGSVADVLVRRLSIPLLLVRGYDAPADLTGDPLMRKILIPLDGSEVAERVLEPAVALGELTDADHTLLRVLPWAPDYSLGYPTGGGLQRPLSDMRRGEAWDYLLRVTKRLKDREFRVDPRLVHDEATTAKAILDYARNHDVDLIGLTTRGGGRWARLFRGSVADRVVRGASVPVLICGANTESDAASYEHRNLAA